MDERPQTPSQLNLVTRTTSPAQPYQDNNTASPPESRNHHQNPRVDSYPDRPSTAKHSARYGQFDPHTDCVPQPLRKKPTHHHPHIAPGLFPEASRKVNLETSHTEIAQQDIAACKDRSRDDETLRHLSSDHRKPDSRRPGDHFKIIDHQVERRSPTPPEAVVSITSDAALSLRNQESHNHRNKTSRNGTPYTKDEDTSSSSDRKLVGGEDENSQGDRNFLSPETVPRKNSQSFFGTRFHNRPQRSSTG